MLFTLAFAVAVMVANVYYPQPILAPLAESLGLRPDAAGLVMTFTQIGYGLGVLFVVPLGDLFENKKVILGMISISVLAEFTLGASKSIVLYALGSMVAGMGASTAQIIVPYASHLYEPSKRGQVIGTLMSGLMLGIMFARPLASLMTEFIGLHSVFLLAAAIMIVMMVRLYFILPTRQPGNTGLNYGQLIWSMKNLVLHTRTLRRRALYQAAMFGSFCIFWTTVPVLLISPAFGFTQKGVAVFALVGVGGAIVAPLAGRMADRGRSRMASILAIGSAMLAFVVGHFLPENTTAAVILLAVLANMLDAGVAAHLVLGQRAIFMIDPNNQARLNGLYVAMVYIGGAIGSALGVWAFTHGGWQTAMTIGFVWSLFTLGLLLTERYFGYREMA